MTNLYKMGVRVPDYEQNVEQGLFARIIMEKLGLAGFLLQRLHCIL